MTKFYLNKEHLTIEDIKTSCNFGGQDIFLLVPFLSEDLYYDVLVPKLGNHNESQYTQWFYTGATTIEQSSTVENCDYSIIPFKFNINDDRLHQICKEAKKYNKNVISFYTDDNSSNINIPENLILFRTSLYRSTKQKNERIMPGLHTDHFCNFINNVQNGISFCGQLTQLRYNIIQKILSLKLSTDFIYRQGFWAPEIKTKTKAKKQYYNNLLNNRYALCIRGEGNFSFRFYEALSFGRIPILLDTDDILPFSKIIDWSKHIIRIKEDEIHLLPQLLKEDNRSMLDNRNLWKEYLSIDGYAKNFTRDI